MGHFSVKNFKKFQHYKDRSPPWIKFYNESLDDYALAALPDASKAHLFAIWLLASRYDNQIPYDSEWVARRINATSPVDLVLLAGAGFIVLDQDCSILLADCKQSACLEREAEREAEREVEKETPLSPPLRGAKPNGSKRTVKRKTALNGEWVIEDGDSRDLYAKQVGMTEGDIDIECDKFENFHQAKGNLMADWDAAWKTWCRNWQTFSKQNQRRV